MIALRRHEILPSQFNDGAPVPQERLAETLLELENKFGAVSCTASGVKKEKSTGMVSSAFLLTFPILGKSRVFHRI